MVIESGRFAQVSNLYPILFDQTVEVAFHPPPERNDHCFVTVAAQSPHDMNRHALSTTWAQVRNNMDDFNLVHDLGGRLSAGFLPLEPRVRGEVCRHDPGDSRQYMWRV